ncbi:argininosuccinate lyase [Candidatus Saganbacteria bacterium]|nr:argininosuccinate lyase [Candidatus Saganbacteria bacterium]
MASKKAWGGRFNLPLAKAAEQFSSSIQYDVRLYKQDIVQSIAYAETLQRAKVLTGAECKKIIRGLEEIMRNINSGKAKLTRENEDIHMNIEMLLIDKIGDVGKKLHTGRSRNDQVATDLRMYLKWEITETILQISRLQAALVDLAEENISVIMPGYTHLQRAQPVLFSHHMLAYFEMFRRDKDRLRDAHRRCDVLPLGSGALSGTNFDLDRSFLAKQLGFSKISDNSMDAISDRDFVIDFLSAASLCSMHLSRLSEEIIIWSSFEFNFIELSDAYSTGSSLMPQKKNPDMAELTRGKAGRIYGNLMSVLTLMKGLPLTYNRDMQEDKEALFDSIDTIKACLSVMTEMLKTMKINKELMVKAVKKGFLTATDLVYYLVRHDVPFRAAHDIVGKIINYCIESNMDLEYVSLSELKKFSDRFSYDVTRYLSAESSTESKDVHGGTAPKQVKEAIKRARNDLLHGKA